MVNGFKNGFKILYTLFTLWICYFLYLSRIKKILTRLTQFKERDWNEIERKSSYWFILKKSISIVRQASLNKTYVSWRILLLYSKRGSYSRRQLAHYQSYSLLCNLAIILLIYILEKLVLVVKTIVIDNYLHVLPQFIFPFNIFLHINMLQKKRRMIKKEQLQSKIHMCYD